MNVSQRIERLPMTGMTRRILFFIAIGLLFDAMDQGMVSGVLASIGTDWELSAYAKSALASAGIFGMIIGAALSGTVADKWGRRKVILITLVIYGLGSIACGLSTNYTMLLIFRFITGFGLGGEIPVACTLASEMSPAKSRGRNVVLVESFWAWGWLIATLVAYLLIPAYGWRIAFLVGGVPALFAAVLRFCVPESPRYLDLVGRYEEADAIVTKMEEKAGVATPDSEKTRSQATKKEPVFKLFTKLWSREYLRSTIVVWVIWFGLNFGYYGFVLWTPSLLMDQGFAMVKSFGFTLIMCLAQLPGYYTAAALIEKIGRKPTLIIYFAGTALAAWFFGHSGTPTAILVSGCLLYFFSLGAWGSTYSYTPELYPTVIRGSGFGWASCFGRIGAFIAPFVVPVVYSSFDATVGFTVVFIVLTSTFAIVALVVAILGKETKGQSII